MPYITLLDVGLGFLETFLGGLKNSKAPVEITTAIQAAIDAVFAHKQDVINKANIEAQRVI